MDDSTFETAFMAAFAQKFADRCIAGLLARLPKPATAQRWMDRKQAAQYLGKTERGIRALAEAGHIKEYGPTRAVLYDREEIDRVMLESGRYVIDGKRTVEEHQN
jgi:hypothetical protein